MEAISINLARGEPGSFKFFYGADYTEKRHCWDAAIIRNREQPAPQLTVTDILCEKTKQQILIDITPDFI